MHPFDSFWLFGTSGCFYLKVEDPHAIHMTTSCRVLCLSRLGAEFPELPLDPGRSGNAFPGCRRCALLLGDDCHENFVWWLEMVQRLGVWNCEASLSDSLVLGLQRHLQYDIIDKFIYHIYVYVNIYIYIYAYMVTPPQVRFKLLGVGSLCYTTK